MVWRCVNVLLGFWAVSHLASPFSFVRPAKFAVSRGALLLLLRPGSDVSILLPWGLRRAVVLVRREGIVECYSMMRVRGA